MKSRYLTMAVGGVSVLLLIAFVLSRNSEPKYQNHSLSYWLDRLDDMKTEKQGQEAVRAIGTNAYPYLMKRLNARESRIEGFLRKKAPLFVWRWWRAWHKGQHVQAMRAFKALGPQMKPLVPQLVQCLTNRWAPVEFVLADLGETALPGVIGAMTNQNSELRARAAACLSVFECDTRSAIPALGRALEDPNQEVAEAAAETLAFKHRQCEAIQSLLHNPDPNRKRLRLRAMQSIIANKVAADPFAATNTLR